MSARPLRGADLLVVAAGGALGALLRYAVDVTAPDTLFPWPTLGINVAGAFALGVLPVVAVVRRSRRAALTVGPGLLGGFTTVSAWTGQVRELGDSGHPGLAGGYLVATLGAGLLAAATGHRLAHRPDPEGAVE